MPNPVATKSELKSSEVDSLKQLLKKMYSFMVLFVI